MIARVYYWREEKGDVYAVGADGLRTCCEHSVYVEASGLKRRPTSTSDAARVLREAGPTTAFIECRMRQAGTAGDYRVEWSRRRTSRAALEAWARAERRVAA